MLAFAAAAPADAASIGLSTCHVDGVRESVLCGSLDVPEDRDVPGGRTIALDIVVVPATGGQPLDDPIVVLAGGPGQAATDLVAGALAFLDEARRRLDIVFVDQRGTDDSNPLDCDLGGELAVFSAGGLPADAGLACLKRLRERADLRLYTSFHAAHDLEAVRQGLGYGRLNLWGGSYGTRMAMVYESLYPDSVRSLVLDGSAPFELVLPQFNAREAQRAFDLLVEACATDEACAENFPNPAGDLRDLLDRLDAAPEPATVIHPRTGETLELTMSRAAVAGTLRAILYQTSRAALVPSLVAEALRGTWGPLVAVGLQAAAASRDTMSLGMTFSVLCSEDHPRLDRAVLDRESAGTFLGTTEADAWGAICDAWPKAELPPGYDEPSPSAVPALLLSGEADPIVPPAWGEATLARYSAGTHVVVPGAGHNVSHLGCVPELIATVPMVGAERAPNLVAFLEQQGAEIVAAPEDPTAAVRAGDLGFALVVAEDYAERWRELRPAQIELIFDASRKRETSRRRQVAGWVRAWDRDVAQLRLLARGVDPGITRVIDLQSVDVASARARGIQILGSLPMFFLLAAFVCAMNVAIDTTAGERERGSLEALLAHAVSPRALAVGKWATAVVFDVLGLVAMLLVSMAVLRPERFEGLDVAVRFGVDEALGVLVVVLPLTLMAPALQMVVAVFSKSFKEAQTYLSLLIFLPMLPGFLLLVEAFEVESWMHAVPVLAQQVQIVDLLRGDGVTSAHFFLGATGTIVAALAMVTLVGHLLGREKIVLAR